VTDGGGQVDGDVPPRAPADRELPVGLAIGLRRRGVRADVVVAEAEELLPRVEVVADAEEVRNRSSSRCGVPIVTR
jgi:hypothetical protein